MRGVGDTLAGLSDFVGYRLCAVDDLENIVYFRFSDPAERQLTIGVESEWVIEDALGAVILSGQPHTSRVMASPPLGSLVVATETQPPRAILLRFHSGQSLRITDNSDRYESFCIPHASVYV